MRKRRIKEEGDDRGREELRIEDQGLRVNED